LTERLSRGKILHHVSRGERAAVCRAPDDELFADRTRQPHPKHTLPQDLYAFEQDDVYNKHIVWTGKEWVDEKTGTPMSMEAQRTQSLLQTQVPPPPRPLPRRPRSSKR
jgi:hypothetical protein